jgi:hypothetical protein
MDGTTVRADPELRAAIAKSFALSQSAELSEAAVEAAALAEHREAEREREVGRRRDSEIWQEIAVSLRLHREQQQTAGRQNPGRPSTEFDKTLHFLQDKAAAGANIRGLNREAVAAEVGVSRGTVLKVLDHLGAKRSQNAQE